MLFCRLAQYRAEAYGRCMSTKVALATELRRALGEMLALQAQGGLHPKLSKAQGFVDGYMRAMLDSRMMTQEEMLKLVAEERARARGPSTRESAGDDYGFSRALA